MNCLPGQLARATSAASSLSSSVMDGNSPVELKGVWINICLWHVRKKGKCELEDMQLAIKCAEGHN